MSGFEWVVEAHACDPRALADLDVLEALFARIVADLRLTVVGDPAWHRFPGAGGITGLALLSESHLAIHTFPEHRSLCLNVFCCRSRPDWVFEDGLRAAVGAGRVHVRRLERRYADAPGAAVPAPAPEAHAGR